jgi:hypothetical protein
MLRPEYRPWPSANAAQLLWFSIVGAALHQTLTLFAIWSPLKSAAQDKGELETRRIKTAVAETEDKEIKTAAQETMLE